MNFSKNCPDGLTFPITQQRIDSLQSGTKIVSPVAMDDPRVLVTAEEIGYKPTMPGDPEFWNELLNVVYLVTQSRSGSFNPRTQLPAFKNDFVSTTLQKDFNVNRPNTGAELVRADWPDMIVNRLAERLIKNGARFRNITNEGNYTNFTNGIVLLSSILAWAVHSVSPTAFAHKYYFGRPRPEEIMHAWANNKLQIPYIYSQELDRLVGPTWKRQIAKDARKFTMYKEGCPNHPAFPAMHSAASAISIILPVILDLTENELAEVHLTNLNIGFFRSYGGVHYFPDNFYGFELAERVMEKILPLKLAEYGANPEEVSALIAEYRTDWLQYV